MSRNQNMIVDYEDDLRLFRTTQLRAAMAALLLVYLVAPFQVTDFWLSVLAYCGVFAIGGLGLNLLTGYTGQVSLGHAFFLAVGAYVAAHFGAELDLPLLLWLPIAALVGALVGIVIGPFALRLRGNYLAVVTLGLVFFGEHLFSNWDSLTGGGAGTPVDADLSIGPLDFADLEIFGRSFTREQSLFWLIWGIVAVCALLTKNIVRTRPGRAMQAVRDRDVAAEVIGVSLLRYKTGAFALSSALAAVAGGLYGAAIQQYVSPTEWTLFLSITYIAVIIVGGMGTVFGPILGAIFVGAIPRIIERFSDRIPFVSTGPTDDGLISVASLNNMIFGLLIIVFLVAEPMGLAAVWRRVKAYFLAWPFSY